MCECACSRIRVLRWWFVFSDTIEDLKNKFNCKKMFQNCSFSIWTFVCGFEVRVIDRQKSLNSNGSIHDMMIVYLSTNNGLQLVCSLIDDFTLVSGRTSNLPSVNTCLQWHSNPLRQSPQWSTHYRYTMSTHCNYYPLQLYFTSYNELHSDELQTHGFSRYWSPCVLRSKDVDPAHSH